LAQHNGFGLETFPENSKAGKRLSKGQYLLLIVQQTVRHAVGPSGLLIAIIGNGSFALSVLVWGWGKKEEETNHAFGKYCVPLQYTQSTCGAALKDDFNYNKRCFVK
jgi:hypothetical protein